MTTPVLICDDSSVARKQMARSLPGDWDIEISFAGNGAEALDAIREGKGDILFLDLNMPVMDGYETLAAIAKDDLPTIVIVVSGDIQPEAKARVQGLGAIDFIKKPIEGETLTNLLSNFGLYTPATTKATESVATEAQSAGALPSASLKERYAARKEALKNVGAIEYRDAIQEVANVAMGQAASLLAQLLKVFVKLPIPNVNILEVSELQMAISHSMEKKDCSAVCQGFIGAGIAGEALLIFNDSSFGDMGKLLNYQGELDETMQLELLMEITSILVGACINGIAGQLDLSFSQGHPVVLGQHVNVGELIHINSKRWKKTVAIEITYEIENYDITCDLLLLFTEDSINNLNQRLSYLVD